MAIPVFIKVFSFSIFSVSLRMLILEQHIPHYIYSSISSYGWIRALQKLSTSHRSENMNKRNFRDFVHFRNFESEFTKLRIWRFTYIEREGMRGTDEERRELTKQIYGENRRELQRAREVKQYQYIKKWRQQMYQQN